MIGPGALSLAVLLATAPACRSSPAQAAGLVERDLDGDGLVDRIVVTESGGSGASTTTLTLTLSTLPAPIELTHETSFDAFVGELAVPPALLHPALATARAAVEDALFPAFCAAPDPSLAWLLDPLHRLRWIEGPPALPTTYALLHEGAWRWYLGHNHGRGEPGGLRALATRGERRLVGTAHGVLLVEPTRHAWLYVHGGGGKLRWPSIEGAWFEGDAVVISLSPAHAPDVAEVRVPLAGGAPRVARSRGTEAP